MVSEVVQFFILTSFSVYVAKGNADTSRKVKRNPLSDKKPPPIEELIRQAGYPVETHEIITEDGYLLTYHRIPCGKDSDAGFPRAPVLLQHGMLETSLSWIVSNQSLGFSLADAGFDVWLGNARGNTHSRKHVKLNPDRDKKKFWDFSWHKMGVYDLPAAIDYILRTTGYSQLSFVGHSMGTTMYFVMGSTRPDYMRKVNVAVALAPVAYLSNVRSPIVKYMYSNKDTLHWITSALGMHVLLANPLQSYEDLYKYTSSNSYLQSICQYLFDEIGGVDIERMNEESIMKLLEYHPAGVSVKTLLHYHQVIDNGFNEYDYGFEKNMKNYGSQKPPAYNMSLITTPICVWWGENDNLVGPESVELTVAHLPNVKDVTRVPYEKFGHTDFIWAIDAKRLVYDGVIRTLKALQQQN